MSQDATPAKKPGRIAEIKQAYKLIQSVDKALGWWMLGAFVGVLLLGILIGWYFGHPIYAAFVALPAGLLAATLVMNRRGNKAMYGAVKGQAGATGAALMGMGKRGWYADEKPVAMDAARGTKMNDLTGVAMVFRALGRPGVVLIGEGPEARVRKVLKAEEKKVERVAPGVPIHLWVMGEGEGQVPVEKIAGKLTRMRPVLTKEETSMVNKRLKSLGGMRPPVPQGIDPRTARSSRSALRGK